MRSAFLTAVAMPFSRRYCTALSRSPFDSASAALQSMMPAPVIDAEFLNQIQLIDSLWLLPRFRCCSVEFLRFGSSGRFRRRCSALRAGAAEPRLLRAASGAFLLVGIGLCLQARRPP